MEVRNRIRELRRQLSLSQAGLAVRAGTCAPYVSFLETYDRPPGRDLRGRIANVLGVSEVEVWPQLGEATEGGAHVAAASRA